MADKKKQILEAAIRCFARKGFRAASIQDIVDELGMAKGSIYFYFKSKDDLYVSVLEHYGDLLQSELEEHYGERELPPRQRLELQLERQFRFFRKHLDFLKTLVTESGIGLNPDIQQVLHKFQARYRLWSVSHLRAIYGERAEPYSADVTALFSGMSMHMMDTLLTHTARADEAELSRYIVRRLDDIVRGLVESEERTIVPPWEWSQLLLEAGRLSDDVLSERVRVRAAIKDRIAASAERLPERRDELLEAADLLERELERVVPNRAVVRGVLLALLELGVVDESTLKALEV